MRDFIKFLKSKSLNEFTDNPFGVEYPADDKMPLGGIPDLRSLNRYLYNAKVKAGSEEHINNKIYDDLEDILNVAISIYNKKVEGDERYKYVKINPGGVAPEKIETINYIDESIMKALLNMKKINDFAKAGRGSPIDGILVKEPLYKTYTINVQKLKEKLKEYKTKKYKFDKEREKDDFYSDEIDRLLNDLQNRLLSKGNVSLPNVGAKN
jgi:hypothetical protein